MLDACAPLHVMISIDRVGFDGIGYEYFNDTTILETRRTATGWTTTLQLPLASTSGGRPVDFTVERRN